MKLFDNYRYKSIHQYAIRDFENFQVEIRVRKDNEFLMEAWLYHKEYGIQMLMFGTELPENLSEMISVVEANIRHYITVYYELYMDK